MSAPLHDCSEDFACMLAEFGLTESAMHRLAQLPADLIEFPHATEAAVAPSRIHGRGLFATHAIASREVIAPARIAGSLTPAGRYTNHARQPNAQLVIAANGDLHEVALRDIAAGEEITNDYRQNARVFYSAIRARPLEEVTRAMVREAMLAALHCLPCKSSLRSAGALIEKR